MKKTTVYYCTGSIGIALYILVLLEIPLYFTYTPTPEGTPPVNIILWRILIDLFIALGLIGFFSGLKNIIAQAAPGWEWVGTLIYSCGLTFATIALVADSIQAGGAWAAGTRPVNPTFVGHGADGALLIYGPINRLLNTIILVVSGILIIKTRLVPVWTAWLGFLIALYNAAFIPTLFYMTTPLDFYSANGWNIPIAAGWFFLWILIISICLIARRR
jgi:hypothetical protein